MESNITRYLLVSPNKVLLQRMAKDLEILSPADEFYVEKLDDPNILRFIDHSASDWNFSYCYQFGLGQSDEDIKEQLSEAQSSMNEDSSLLEYQVEVHVNFTLEQRYKLYKEYHSKPEIYLAGARNLSRVIRSGRFYEDPEKYRFYQGQHMQLPEGY